MNKFIINLLIIVFCAFGLNTSAQTVGEQWHICLGGSEWDQGKGIIRTGDTYWVVGQTESNDGDISYNHGAWDVWLVNVDNSGNLISEKTFGGSNFDGGFVDIKKLNDTTFYIVSRSKSNDGDIGMNPWPGPLGNYWVIQINNYGEIIWEKILGGSEKERIRDATITNDGGIIALGLSASDDGDISNHHGDYDLWMVKLSKDGEKQWDMSLGGIGFEEGGSVKQTTDGGYIVVGDTDGRGGGNFDSTCNHHEVYYMDAWIIKLDSLRNIEWQQCYGGYYHDGASNILELEDGYIVLGLTQSDDGDVTGFHGAPGTGESGTDIWVFKIDFSGNLIWQKCLGGTSWDWARNIFTTSDGGYMVVGSTASNDGDVVGYHGITTGIYDDVWMAKLTADGELTWQYCYGGGGQERMYRGVIQKSDYNYVMTIGTDTDEWQCNGVMWPSLRVFELGDTTAGIEHAILNEHIDIYPNPASSTLTVSYNRIIGNTTTIELLEMYGNIVIKQNMPVGKQQVSFDVKNIATGLYFVRVVVDDEVVGMRKVIVK